MSAGLLGTLVSERPTTSLSAVNKLARRASPQGLRHLRRIAHHDTDAAELRAALRARNAVSHAPDLTMSIERMEDRQEAHDAALAARAAARATLDRLTRLPPAHTAALIRLSTPANLRPNSLAGWKAHLDWMDAQDRAHPGHIKIYERHENIATAEAMLTRLSPPGAEASSLGTWHVRGDEDGISRAAVQAAEHWHELYIDNPGLAERREPWIAREHMDPRWHRRRIRREALRAGAYWDTALRLACPACPYVSQYTHHGWQQRRSRQREWAARQAFVCDDGTTIPLPVIQARGRKARRATTYAMLKGMECHGERNGYTAFFLTLTLPGPFHAVIKGRKAADGTYPDAYPNPEWTPGHGPAAAWGALTETWKQLRARLAKFKPLRDWFGISIPEPHHDGTPHLHALVWLPSAFVHRGRTRGTGLVLRDILRDIAPGHQSRLEVVRKRDDRVRPDGTVRRFLSPASYVLKYAMKAMDDEEGMAEQGEAGERHRAWASSRGIRRMRPVGSHGSIRVWQRIWVSRDDERLPPRAEAARAAMRHSAAAGEAAAAAPADSRERTDARARQAEAAAEALALIGALPGATLKFKLGYDESETEHGRPTRKAVRIEEHEQGEITDGRGRKRIGWVPTGAAFPLKMQAGKMVEVATSPGVPEGAVTLAASYPRSEAEGASWPLDEDEIWYVSDTEALISKRHGMPGWESWCEGRRERLARLRRPPPDSLAA